MMTGRIDYGHSFSPKTCVYYKLAFLNIPFGSRYGPVRVIFPSLVLYDGMNVLFCRYLPGGYSLAISPVTCHTRAAHVIQSSLSASVKKSEKVGVQILERLQQRLLSMDTFPRNIRNGNLP